MLNLISILASVPCVTCFDNVEVEEVEVEKVFTQDEVNTYLADDRRKHQARFAKLEIENNKLIVENQTLSANIEGLVQRNTDIESMFNDLSSKTEQSTIERSISAAATTGDAIIPDQLVALLKPHTSITDGEIVIQVGGETFTPDGAIEKMRELKEFQNLFKSNVVGGVGGNSTTGGLRPGKTDKIGNLTPSEYREMRKMNPGALGLR